MSRIDDAITNLESAIEFLEDESLEDALDEIEIATGSIKAELSAEPEE